MHTFLSFSRLARDSSVLVFLGPIREQARSWPFRILTVVGTYSHGTAASVASGFFAFAPVPSVPSLRLPLRLRPGGAKYLEQRILLSLCRLHNADSRKMTTSFR